jgi:hypothetical protein
LERGLVGGNTSFLLHTVGTGSEPSVRFIISSVIRQFLLLQGFIHFSIFHGVKSSDVDRHRLDEDPDPDLTVYFDADPDPYPDPKFLTQFFHLLEKKNF